MVGSGSSGGTDNEGKVYVPGMYRPGKPNVQAQIDKVFDDWQRQRKMDAAETGDGFPVICFSRRIGVGALEIADILAGQIGYHVIDREILEYLANRRDTAPELAVAIDRQCPCETKDDLEILFGVKSFHKSEYSRLLFRAIFSFAALGPAIFVGRGAHLILPRDRVLAVRLICSDSFRTARIAGILGIDEADAWSRLQQLDAEQQRFFETIYGTTGDSPDEYDIVVNRDFFHDPAQVADIVRTALVQKFGASSCR